MVNVLDQLMDYLQANQTDPITYLLVFFLFSVAAAIILPIPIEIGLVWNPGMFFPIKALDLGLGKAVGATVVFFIPSTLGKAARRIERWGPIRRTARLLRLAGERSGVGNLRAYRAVGSLLKALKAAIRRSGINRSRIYGRLGNSDSCPTPTPSIPRWGWLSWLARKSEGFTRKYGVIAMYLIMSIPGMIDTVPLYIFSIINKEQTLIPLRDFVLANFLAGINRAFIIYALLELMGIRLF